MTSRQGHIVLIGFGNMGQALASGWVERGFEPTSIQVVDPQDAAREAAERCGFVASATIADAARHSDAGRHGSPGVVLLAVKPSQLEDALRACQPLVTEATLFLSIAAGKPIEAITAVLGDAAAVVRAMPNTPAAIGKGMTVLTASARVSATQRVLATDLMSAVGAVEWLDDERLMDAVTALSGSGPAYVFLLIECLTEAGVAAGLDAAFATRLATATVAGAGAYAEASGEAAAELRRRVTSPGGTTEAALRVLMTADAMSALFERAVSAAAARSRELSQ